MKTRTMNANDVLTLIASENAVRIELSRCVNLHYDAIMQDIGGFIAERESSPDEWARLCVTFGILSTAAPLDKNIASANVIYRAIASGVRFAGYDDVVPYAKSVRYSAQNTYGRNLTAIANSCETIATLSHTAMSLSGLSSLVAGNYLSGLGLKTMRWSLAAYDAYTPVVTIDRHMIRKFLALGGYETTEELAISDKAYLACETFILSLIRDTFGADFPPLVAQWAVWNESRHPGKHADHSALSLR